MSTPLQTSHSEALYTDGRYLDASGGNWHLEDAPFKAKYVDLMVRRHKLHPKTVCEIGCGAGGVLANLRQLWGTEPVFTGFDISPQAHALSQQFSQPNLQFVLGDAFAQDQTYDLVLVMDVVEHVENCFEFLRQARDKGTFKLYHIPLEITCSSALRDMLHEGYNLGHIHHFSRSTALAALKHTGHKIIDTLYTPVAFECPKLWRTRVTNFARRLLPQTICARLLGGYSLLVLAK